MSYLVIVGNPYRMFSGITTFTSLISVGKVETAKEAAQLIRDNYDNYAGLIAAFDTDTGEVADV